MTELSESLDRYRLAAINGYPMFIECLESTASRPSSVVMTTTAMESGPKFGTDSSDGTPGSFTGGSRGWSRFAFHGSPRSGQVQRSTRY